MCTAFSDGLCHPIPLSFIRLKATASSKTNPYWFANAVIVQNLIRRDNQHRAQNQSGFHKCAGCFLAMEKQPAQQPKNLSSAAEQVDSDAISRRDAGFELVAAHDSSLHFDAFTAQICQAFGKVVIIMFGINRAADRFFRQIGIRQAGVAAMVFIAPRGIWPIAAPLHFVHDEDVVGIEKIGAMGEDVVYGGVRPAPAVAAQGGGFAVLAEQLGTWELGNKGLMP